MCCPALGAGALLVFVDSMKELPATLLLRPFNFNTLATQVFTLASLYRYEEAGLSALSIVVVESGPGAPPPWRHCRRSPGRPGQPAQHGLDQGDPGARRALDKSLKSGGGLAISGQSV